MIIQVKHDGVFQRDNSGGGKNRFYVCICIAFIDV